MLARPGTIMTIDQRLEFLVQSTESLHSSINVRWTVVQRNSEDINKLTIKMDKLTDVSLALSRVILNQENRLNKLDGESAPEE
jgi:hypothetical protein